MGYQERDGGEDIVILIHGNMTSSVHWDLVLENMDERFKLYAVDLRGFGTSTYHQKITAIKDFSNDVKAFVDTLEISDFSLVGWSLGGAVCQQFCADYPDLCKKLVLLASGSTKGFPFFGTDEKGLPDTTKRLQTIEEVRHDKGKTAVVQGAYDQGNREVLKMIWDLSIYTNKKPEADRYEKYVDDMMTQRNLAETYQALNIFNISGQSNGLTDGNNQVRNINLPVLILRGENDLVVSKQMTDEIIEDFEGKAEFVELKNCGHSPLVDDLATLLSHMERFLTRKESHA